MRGRRLAEPCAEHTLCAARGHRIKPRRGRLEIELMRDVPWRLLRLFRAAPELPNQVDGAQRYQDPYQAAGTKPRLIGVGTKRAALAAHDEYESRANDRAENGK